MTKQNKLFFFQCKCTFQTYWLTSVQKLCAGSLQSVLCMWSSTFVYIVYGPNKLGRKLDQFKILTDSYFDRQGEKNVQQWVSAGSVITMGYLQRFISHLFFVKVIIHQSHYPWGSVLYMYRICKYMLISKQWRTNVFTDRKKSSKINCLIWFCKLPTHSAMAHKSFNWQKLFWQIEKAEFHLRTRPKCMQRDACILIVSPNGQKHTYEVKTVMGLTLCLCLISA